ncbi:MAG: hypothetical protein WEA77_06960 [Hyphomonas sp.]|uniref:hypothetical protein n=1 Tax=Hyphomonas sp. TaxID=87 RepID=UPI0034A0A1C6
MRLINKSLLSASMMLGAAMSFTGLAPALAQGADGIEAEEPAEFPEETEFCAEDEDCADAEVAAEEAGPVEPESEPADEPATAEPGAIEPEGAVLAAPGSTDESNPGGSTRPGTRPDD